MFKGEASTPPVRFIYLFIFVKTVPIKANLTALYAFHELIKEDVCLFYSKASI